MEVLRLLQTHMYGNGLSAKTRDCIYWLARGYRWMGDNLFKLMQRGVMMVVPRFALQSERKLPSTRIGA